MYRKTWLLCCVVALALPSLAVGAPLAAPFLSVDINGGQGAFGPTEDDPPRWVGWDVNQTSFGFGGTTVNQAFGGVNAELEVIGFGGPDARDRGDTNPDEGVLNNDMLRDFVFAARDTAGGFGRHYNRLSLSGLDPNTDYEVTLHSYDPFSSSLEGFIAVGTENPSEWLDNNVGAGQSYQPDVGGVNNPIPTLFRTPDSGPWPSDPVLGVTFEESEYYYATTVVLESDVTGALTVYSWADPDSYSGNGISLLNGFEVGVAIPEPSAMALILVSFVGLVANRRR